MKILWKIKSQWVFKDFCLGQIYIISRNGSNKTIDIFSNLGSVFLFYIANWDISWFYLKIWFADILYFYYCLSRITYLVKNWVRFCQIFTDCRRAEMASNDIYPISRLWTFGLVSKLEQLLWFSIKNRLLPLRDHSHIT